MWFLLLGVRFFFSLTNPLPVCDVRFSAPRGFLRLCSAVVGLAAGRAAVPGIAFVSQLLREGQFDNASWLWRSFGGGEAGGDSLRSGKLVIAGQLTEWGRVRRGA